MMTIKNIISPILITSLILVSCKKELTPQKTTYNNTPTTRATTDTLKSQLINPPGAPQTAKSIVATAKPNAVMQTAATYTAKGMNPAHGQTGHRCDIPVGAPLNTPANNNTAQQTATPTQAVTTVAKTNTSTVSTNTTVKTAKGMNPPHGQDGHRCDIPVGSPLNTPVAKAATPTQTENEAAKKASVLMNPTYTPPAANTSSVVTAPGMNPPHGQEGHRCDITVGAPLPKS